MESASTPPRYEDIVYATKVVQQDVSIGVPPAVLPATIPATVQPTSVISTTVPATASLRVILNVVNTLTHFFLGTIVFSAFVIAVQGPMHSGRYSYQSSFHQHIILCVTGYMILLSQSILSFSPHGGWAHGLKYPQKQLVYGVMQILGSSLALAGCFVKITEWNEYPMSGSGHAVTGWMVMLLTLLSLIGGIVEFKYADRIKQGPYKNAQSQIFLLTLTMAFICLAIAFAEPYYFYNVIISDISVTFTVFAMIGVLISAKFK